MAQDTPRKQTPAINPVDPIWHRVRQEASDAVKADPAIATFIYAGVLNQPSLEQAVAHRVAERLDHPDVPADLIRQAFDDMFQAAAPISPFICRAGHRPCFRPTSTRPLALARAFS